MTWRPSHSITTALGRRRKRVGSTSVLQISAESAEDAAALSQNAKEKGFHKVLTWKD